jgi:molybdopterin-guanine dinucleotide biosynthesis protein B
MLPSHLQIRCLAFVAPSGTGKTTLLSAVVEVLARRGLRVAVLKATHHHIALDTPGKDSWRHAEAGAKFVGIVGPGSATLFLDPRPAADAKRAQARELAEWLFACPAGAPDLVLCEGFFSQGGLPKLRVVRGEWPEDPWRGEDPADVIAAAWDGSAEERARRAEELQRPVWPLDAQSIAEQICERAGFAEDRGACDQSTPA